MHPATWGYRPIPRRRDSSSRITTTRRSVWKSLTSRFSAAYTLEQGKLVGQKAPLRLREIWGIRIRLQLAKRTRELALSNLAVDSKLRSCDLVRLRVRDVAQGDQVANRAIVMQQKTRRPVQFEITVDDALEMAEQTEV